MLTKRRLNLRRNMNDRLAVAPPPRGEPSTTKLPALLSGASSNSSSKFSNDLAGRFFTDNSFAAHSRDKEREVEREAQRKAKQRAKATQNRRRRLEKEMAKEAARIEAMERKLSIGTSLSALGASPLASTRPGPPGTAQNNPSGGMPFHSGAQI